MSDQLSIHDLVIFLPDPEDYAWFAADQKPCRVCSQAFPIDPIANFFTNTIDHSHFPGAVCDDCASVIAPATSRLVQRLREVVARSEFGVNMVHWARFEDSSNGWVAITNRCAHCEEIFEPDPSQRLGDFFLCEKVTRYPVCDACAELLASGELFDLLCSLRQATAD